MLIDQSRSFMNFHIRYVHWITAGLPNCEIWGFCSQHLATLATPTIRSIKCKQSPVYGVFNRYFHIPLPIVTKHELGLPFPPRNLPIKFGTNPSTIFLLSWSQTHTDKPTPVKTYSLAFAGRTMHFKVFYIIFVRRRHSPSISCCWLWALHTQMP